MPLNVLPEMNSLSQGCDLLGRFSNLHRCQGDGWSAYSERVDLHKHLKKQVFESDLQPEKQEQAVRMVSLSF